jgi:hypothetical protein
MEAMWPRTKRAHFVSVLSGLDVALGDAMDSCVNALIHTRKERLGSRYRPFFPFLGMMILLFIKGSWVAIESGSGNALA